jgi:YggT family protein
MAGSQQAVFFLVGTVLELVIWVFWLRLLLQAFRADFYNPISQFVLQATRYPTQWLQPMLPVTRGINLAVVAGLLLAGLIYVYAIVAIVGSSVGPGSALFYTVMKLIIMVLGLYTFTLFVQAILSWVGPGTSNPATNVLFSLNEPLLRPVRNILPPIGGLDLSPLAMILLLQVLSRLIPLPGVLR